MKVRNGRVTNSSSTSFIFAGESTDTIIDSISSNLLFSMFTEKFLSKIEHNGFYRVIDKDGTIDKISWLIIPDDYCGYIGFSVDSDELIRSPEILDDKVILQVRVNYQGDGHIHGCIRDDDWYHLMKNTGRVALTREIFDKEFVALFW